MKTTKVYRFAMDLRCFLDVEGAESHEEAWELAQNSSLEQWDTEGANFDMDKDTLELFDVFDQEVDEEEEEPAVPNLGTAIPSEEQTPPPEH